MPSFFMLPNMTAIMIMLSSLGNHVIYSFKGKILDSGLQSSSLGRPDLLCLPGHCRGAVIGIHASLGSKDCLTTPAPSGSRTCWVWMQVGRTEFLESE